MAKKIQIPYKYYTEYDNICKCDIEAIRFTMPEGEDIVIEVGNTDEYYPEDRDTYAYPSNIDDRVVFWLGEDCVKDSLYNSYYENKIRTRRALVRAYYDKYIDMKNYEEGVIEISETYLKENK
tara:strand:+ start:2299 stop:2667 length:369 start_codon:yes stop_codon:yes gene_type:complete